MATPSDEAADPMAELLGEILDRLERLEAGAQPGCWVARYSDWSGIAVFGSELEALRYTNDHDGMVASFVQWGEVR